MPKPEPRCQVKKCGHSATAHVRHTKGKFMGQRGECEYSRCGCVGYVPHGWKPSEHQLAKIPPKQRKEFQASV